MSEPVAGVAAGSLPPDDAGAASSAIEVFRNRPFLLLWLSQAFTQIGGNMVIYGLTVIIFDATRSNTAVGLLILTFLVPAVLFSAVAGVYVDRVDRRTILIVTNILRAAAFVLLFLAGGFLPAILILNVVVSTITVFFGPAEAAMIPFLVPRKQLVTANGIFTLTLNAAFALGFALLGPIVVTIAGAPTLILIVAACYLVAAGFCWTLPSNRPTMEEAPAGGRGVVGDAEQAMGSTIAQLREGVEFIRANRMVGWSLVYLGIAASLVGVLGVLGPDFATDSLGLQTKDFVVVVLPLGFGIVTGILLLNSFSHLVPRRRVIEFGLVTLGVLLVALAAAGPISRFLQGAESSTGLPDMSAFTSMLAVVVAIALVAGMSYAFVAIPSQTQLQEEVPEDVRGRVFGVLNMLVSVASFLPIIIVAPASDIVGTTAVLIVVAGLITFSGVASILTRGPLKPAEARAPAMGLENPAGFDPVAVATVAELEHETERRAERSAAARAAEDTGATGEDTGATGEDTGATGEDTLDAGIPVVDARADR